MPRSYLFLLCFVLIMSLPNPAKGQEVHSIPTGSGGNLKTVVVATVAKSDSLIVVPPAVSMTFGLKSEKKKPDTNAGKLPEWLSNNRA
jgi:hypothetical protein